jgi:hypothetical protein
MNVKNAVKATVVIAAVVWTAFAQPQTQAKQPPSSSPTNRATHCIVASRRPLRVAPTDYNQKMKGAVK